MTSNVHISASRERMFMLAGVRLDRLARRLTGLSNQAARVAIARPAEISQSPRRIWTSSAAFQTVNHSATRCLHDKLEKLLLEQNAATGSPAIFVPPPALPETAKVELRPYQQTANQACLDGFASGLTRLGVSSPTGSGKTTMFIGLIPKMATFNRHPGERRGQTLILVGSVELAKQAVAAAKAILGRNGLWILSREIIGRLASLTCTTIATYQTLSNAVRLRKFDPKLFSLIIVDEAHHAAAASYIRILHYFNDGVVVPKRLLSSVTLDHGHQVPIVGFTATFSRPDELALGAVFQKIVYHCEVATMMADGWLAPVETTAVKCDLGLGKLSKTNQKDFNQVQLATVVDNEGINSIIVATYLEMASERRSTLVFCIDLKHVRNLETVFKSAGVDARSINGEHKAHERNEILGAFRQGEFPVLINCMLLTEGADVPPVDCVIIARPTMSENLMIQMIGRGLRLSPETGKKDCLIINMVDQGSRPRGLSVIPTLLGGSLDNMPRDTRSRRVTSRGKGSPGYELCTQMFDPRAIKLVKERAAQEGDLFRRAHPVLRRQSDPLGLDEPGRNYKAKMTGYAWTYCHDRYALPLWYHGRMTIGPSSGDVARGQPTFDVTYHPKGGAKPRKVVTSRSLADCMDLADGMVERTVGDKLAKQLLHDAEWRARPANVKTLEMIAAMGLEEKRDGHGAIVEIEIAGEDMKVGDITQGHASAVVTAMIHGGHSITPPPWEDKSWSRNNEPEDRPY